MDIHERLNTFLKEKGWTRYRLARESGLSESTITNIFKRGNTPTIATLEIICTSTGVTLSQFFAENEMIELSPELKSLFDEWQFLSSEQKDAVLRIIKLLRK